MDSQARDSLRFLLPVMLAQRLEGLSPQFGKTVFMKLVYLLQEVYKVPLGYRFTLYTYGPYSTEVPADLDRAKIRGLVSVDYVEADAGFKITPGPRDYGANGVDEAFASYESQLGKLVETFGRFRAKDLELRTTIVYVWKMMDTSEESVASEVVKVVHQLKPHFSEKDIRAATDELKRNSIIGFGVKY